MKLHDLMVFVYLLSVIVANPVAHAADHRSLVCMGAKVYPSPSEPPVEDAVLIVNEGKITVLEPRDRFKQVLPGSATKIDCLGKVVVAGFWNSHVHFEPGWDDAAIAPSEKLQARMREMLTRWGFTTVWDLGSTNTIALRRRVNAGEVPGPNILMTGDIFPKNGHPVYLPAKLALPEAASPQEAAQMAQGYLSRGMDGIKLFTGSYMGAKPVVNMDTSIVKAAVDVAHAQGKPVFAHPQNRAGVDNALAGGVDILAHTVPTEGTFTPDELAEMKRKHTALIPTLTLWTTVVQDPAVGEGLVQAGVDQLKSYSAVGGTILFGTDVGFMGKYDTTQELEFMARAMGWRDILASLTTSPSAFFKASTKGRLDRGMDADLVVLDKDPALDIRNLAKVAYTIRGGAIIYQK